MCPVGSFELDLDPLKHLTFAGGGDLFRRRGANLAGDASHAGGADRSEPAAVTPLLLALPDHHRRLIAHELEAYDRLAVRRLRRTSSGCLFSPRRTNALPPAL